MDCFKFANFLLGFLFVMTALRDSTASHHLLGDQDRDEVEVGAERGNQILQTRTRREHVDGGRAVHRRKFMFGDKTMSVQKLPNADIENEIGIKSTVTQKTSGESSDDRVKKSLGMLNGDKNQEPKAFEYTSFVTSRTGPHATIFTRPKHGKHLQTMSVKASLGRSSSNIAHRQEVNRVSTPTSLIDESEKLVEAAKEMVSLMHRDYKGMGRRRSPVHNNEPRH